MKDWREGLVAALLVLGLFAAPIALRVHNQKEQFDESKARLDAATAHFQMRCKSAGEKITRTVVDVDGVVWMKWRAERDGHDDYDQFKLFDPYGRDCAGEECIAQLLRLENTQGRFEREVELRKGRYRYVESIDPADGKRYRFTGTMKLMPAWTTEAIERFRRDRGTDVPESAHWFQLERRSVDKFSARYGITWDDISTTEDRDQWIAGGSLKVIDLQANEVIAERIGYMMDRGLGSQAGFRTPWVLARRSACPAFPGSQGQRSWPATETMQFAARVARPTKGD